MLVEARGIASADDAWLRFTTPATWSVWAPLIRSVDASDDELVVGTTGRVQGPPGVAVDFEVTAVDPAERTWSWRAGRGPAEVHMDHHVVPAAGGGSRAFLRVPGRSAPLLQPYRAGAFAEGPYEVAVRFTPPMLRLVKPEFRGEFAVRRSSAQPQ